MKAERIYQPNYKLIDKALIPVFDLVQALGDISGQIQNEVSSMSIEKMIIDMPFEIDIRCTDSDDVVLGSSPPTQEFETSFMPVLHRIKLTIEPHNEELT